MSTTGSAGGIHRVRGTAAIALAASALVALGTAPASANRPAGGTGQYCAPPAAATTAAEVTRRLAGQPGGASLQELARLTASDGAAGDQLGTSVAISGTTVAVGAPGATVGGNAGQGAVYVFTVSGSGRGGATQVAKLTASGGAPGDNLGQSVAIEDGTVVAGAPGTNGGRGAAYVFTEPGGGWASETQTAKLTASGAGTGDSLGSSVALDGTTVVAGAPQATTTCHDHSGTVYVFTEPGGGWADETQTARLTASAVFALARLGTSVAISGTTVVAGAPSGGYGTPAPFADGTVYVFTEPGGGWASETQTARLTVASAAGPGSSPPVAIGLGTSVAVSGTTVAAGDPFEGFGAAGAVYVFTEPGGGWADETQTGELTASDVSAGDELGTSVAAAGGTVAAGATGSGNGRGATYLFTQPAGGWVDETQSGELTASDGAAGDLFGSSVELSGGLVAAGAPDAGASSGQGTAYVFGPAGPPPPPRTLLLARFYSPHAGTHWRAGSVIPVTTQVTYGDGTPIPGWLGGELGAGCELTLRVSGAQHVPARCLRWNPATQRFGLRWKTHRRPAGTVTLTAQLLYRTTASISERITLTGHRRISRHRAS